MCFAVDLDRLKALPNYIAIRRFSSPPQLSDLSGFGLDNDDVNDLKKCKPENCEIQLPAENIEQFNSQIDWSGADPVGQVNDLAKKMALETLLAYQKSGNAALGTEVPCSGERAVPRALIALKSSAREASGLLFVPTRLPQSLSSRQRLRFLLGESEVWTQTYSSHELADYCSRYRRTRAH
jgi:hypothetical protein